ncbi:MAG TPA: GNAT family protein [Candidatus Limnocylindrales bacterium]|nr:GNAT family protein [Candidatus Limnocylindrales bacterium]
MVTLDQPRDVWNPPSIEGPRVVLRYHRLDDLPHVRRWYRDPELARLTRYSLQPMTDDEVDRFFHGRLMSPETVAYAIDLRDSGRLIGLTTFSHLDPDNGSVIFHISIGEPDAWNQGFGTEATGLMLQLAFERIGLHRVGLSVFSFNERAIRSYQKAGFRLEGRAREAIARDGERFDELTMGILAPDWRARRGGGIS